MSEVKRVSETKAARMVGLKRADQFYKNFVLSGLIEPIQYPAESRRSYVKKEVDTLLESCRLTLKD